MTAQDTSLDDLLLSGIDHHRNRRLDEAEAIYAEVLDTAPENVRALSGSAILMFERGQRTEAISRLEAAIALEPANADLHNNLGTMLKIEKRKDEAAAAWQRALELDPDQPEVLSNVALLHRDARRYDEARALLERAVALDPDQLEANHNLGQLYIRERRFEEAAACFERHYAAGKLPIVSPMYHVRLLRKIGQGDRAAEIMRLHADARPDDPIVGYEASAILGEAVDAAPMDYVREKFDQFAETFDDVLGMLQYQAPDRVAELVQQMCGSAVVPLIVDLGCGTGLAGPGLRRNAHRLVGVDLSVAMMERAAERMMDGRTVYDQLVEEDITLFLEAVPAGAISISVAVDTLVYLGRLEAFFAALARATRPGGAFVSTFEQAPPETPGGFKLQESGRFAHTDAYVAEVAAQSGFALRKCDACVLRLEFGEGVTSTLQLFERLADTSAAGDT